VTKKRKLPKERESKVSSSDIIGSPSSPNTVSNGENEESFEQLDPLETISSEPFFNEIVYPRNATLPPSWQWLEGSGSGSGSESLKCVRLLEAGDEISILKMIAIVGDGISYYVKGRRLSANSNLKTYFCTMADLNEAISAFDEITLCPGILDRYLMNVKDLPSGIRNNNCWRSKDCCHIVTGKQDICDKCLCTLHYLKRKMTRMERLAAKKKKNSHGIRIRNTNKKLARRDAKLQVSVDAHRYLLFFTILMTMFTSGSETGDGQASNIN